MKIAALNWWYIANVIPISRIRYRYLREARWFKITNNYALRACSCIFLMYAYSTHRTRAKTIGSSCHNRQKSIFPHLPLTACSLVLVQDHAHDFEIYTEWQCMYELLHVHLTRISFEANFLAPSHNLSTCPRA